MASLRPSILQMMPLRLVRTSLVLSLFSGLIAIATLAGSHRASAQGLPVVAETYGIGENAFVRALAGDQGRDALWVGTSLGIMQVNLKTRAPENIFTRSEGLANEHIHAARIGPDGRLWLGTNAGGLSIFDGKAFQTLFPMHGLADFWVKSVAFSSDGKAWVGTLDGANVLDARTGDFTTFRDQLIDKRVQGIAADGQNRVWFGTDGGVSMYDGVLWWSYRHSDGLGAAATPGAALSGDGGVATDYNPNQVMAVHTDNQGRGVWFGTWGGGASLFDGEGNWRSYSEVNGMAGSIVYSIAQEPNGVMWFGTNKGLSRFDGNQWESWSVGDGLVSENVYAVTVDHRGMVWVGGRGGLTRLIYEGAN